MDLRCLGFLGAACAALISLACGGTVVAGTGGGSADSTSDAGTSGTDASAGSTSTTSSSTSSGSTAECEHICDQLESIGCENHDYCVYECIQTLATPCGDLFTAYVQCHADFATDCIEVPPACEASTDAYLQCYALGCNGSGQLCSGTGSGGGETSCSCSEDCDAGSYEVSCTSSAGQGTCACSVDGVFVGQCEEMSLSCDVHTGCCSTLFW
jgi:hypothetical protein